MAKENGLRINRKIVREYYVLCPIPIKHQGGGITINNHKAFKDCSGCRKYYGGINLKTGEVICNFDLTVETLENAYTGIS